MKGRTITGTIEVTKLISMLAHSTEQFKHEGALAQWFTELISEQSDNIMMPTVLFMADLCEEYKQRMLTLYNGTFGLFDSVTKIPDEVKITQAAVLDGLCYGYNCEKATTDLYTMRVDIFGDELEEKDLKKIMESNLVGEIKALKFSYEYQTGCDNLVIDYKLGIHRTKLDNDEVCVLCPFLGGVVMLQILKRFMDMGLVVKVGQEVSTGIKVRCVTEKQELLQAYCDDAGAVIELKSEYNPLDGFFYAPVLGSPSTTSMMTNIGLFRVCELKRLKNRKQLSDLGVQKPKDPISVEIEENYIIRKMLALAGNEGSGEFENLIQNIPNREALGDVDRDISDREIRRWLHVCKNADRRAILKNFRGSAKDIETQRGIYSEQSRPATTEEMQNLQELFKNNICKVLIKKKDGTFSSMTVTNNTEILKKVYGEEYFKYYESVGVRAYALQDYLEQNGDSLENITDGLAKFGFEDLNPNEVSRVAGAISPGNSDCNEAYIVAIYSVMGKSRKASGSGNSIMVRSLSGRINYKTGSADEYYKNIDPSKVKRILIVG